VKNYALWSIRTRTYLMDIGFDIWKYILTGYKPPTYPKMIRVKKKASENNAKAMNFILCGLS